MADGILNNKYNSNLIRDFSLYAQGRLDEWVYFRKNTLHVYFYCYISLPPGKYKLSSSLTGLFIFKQILLNMYFGHY